jgi:hypothetical protein
MRKRSSVSLSVFDQAFRGKVRSLLLLEQVIQGKALTRRELPAAAMVGKRARNT